MNKISNVINATGLRIKRFDSHSLRRKKCNYFLIYTVIMAVVGVLVFLPFLKEKRSLVWIPDALDQHLVTLRYYAQWLQDIVKTLFTTGRLDPVMFDFQLGVGGDVFTGLSFYTIGDPINLLSVFVPVKYIELFYIFTIFLRIYLAGATFSAFCLYCKKGRFQTLMGAVIYAFCGYALNYSVRHPFFMLGMIYLPLLLIGIEKIYKNEKPNFFIAATFLMGISNFYFLYILTILIVVYGIVRYFHYKKENTVAAFFKNLFRFGGYYLTGILLSAFILLPVVVGFLGNGRIGAGGHHANLFFMQPMEYINMFTGIFNSGTSRLGVISLCAFALILLFTRKEKRFTSHKWFVVILFVFAVMPLFGYIFNNFNYVSDRWTFAFAFGMAFVFVEMLPYMKKMSPRYVGFGLVLTLTFFAGYYVVKSAPSKPVRITIFAILFSVFVLYFLYIYRTSRFRKTYNTGFKIIICLVVCILTVVGSYTKYSPSVGNYVSEFTKLSNPPDSTSAFSDSAAHMVNTIKDDDFYRMDISTDRNELFSYPLEYGYNGTSVYLSTTDSNMFTYGTQLYCINKDQSPSKYSGFDNRTALNAFAAVKYIATESGRSAYIPFGYEKIRSEQRPNSKIVDELYENKYFLPLGYTYTGYITQDEFQRLTPAQRQQAMLQAVVVDETLEGYKKTTYENDVTELPFTVSVSGGVKKTGENQYRFTKDKGTIDFKFQGQPNSETYICFNNVQFEFASPYEKPEMFLASNATAGQIKSYKQANKYTAAQASGNVIVKNGERVSSTLIRSTTSNFYCGVHDFIMNTGYSEEAIHELSVRFSQYGTLTYDSISIISVPMDTYPEKIQTLKQDVLQDVTIGRDTITGTVSLEEDKILQLSIPYSANWKAKVNGEEKELMKSNVMYMALPLEAGENEVYLYYYNPWLIWGTVISLLTIAVIITVIAIRRKNKRQQPKTIV